MTRKQQGSEKDKKKKKKCLTYQVYPVSVKVHKQCFISLFFFFFFFSQKKKKKKKLPIIIVLLLFISSLKHNVQPETSLVCRNAAKKRAHCKMTLVKPIFA